MERMAASPGFRALRDGILALARLDATDRVLDIGAGTGLLTLAAAPRVASVSALDVSPAMCSRLREKLDRLELDNAESLLGTATELPLADASIDVVLSNYCFHHLRDCEKVQALAEIERVLRPGGRLVFADMMFRVGIASRRDRAVIGSFLKRMIRRGPAGLVRLAKNGMRMLGGRSEHPAGVEWWREALRQTGFVAISVRALQHEGGIASARKSGR
jgi:ubiquinone/menaquinone biosynthesis C-methylase UbiE